MESKLTQLTIQLSNREQELNESNSRVRDLTKEANRLELDIQRYKHERDSVRKELDGEKELCNKLDIEIEKLNAEVHEYSEIRQDVRMFNEFLKRFFFLVLLFVARSNDDLF